MPEEKVSQSDKAADKTSPAEVAAAYEEAIVGGTGKEEAKTEVEVQPVEESKPVEVQPVKEDEYDLDQRERSRLGRRLKRVEEGLGKLDRLEQILQRMEYSAPRKDDKTSSSEYEIPEVITTGEDVLKTIRIDREQARKAAEDYQSKYIKHIHSLESDDDPISEEVVKELFTFTSPFNMRRGDDDNPSTWNPTADAEINYYKAKAAILASKHGKSDRPKANVRGEKVPVSADISTDLTMKERTQKEVKLDPYAQEYLNIVGATDAQRKKYLNE